MPPFRDNDLIVCKVWQIPLLVTGLQSGMPEQGIACAIEHISLPCIMMEVADLALRLADNCSSRDDSAACASIDCAASCTRATAFLNCGPMWLLQQNAAKHLATDSLNGKVR